MHKDPRISVVIPTIGRHSLVKAVRSVLDQTVSPLEVIVCNDGIDPLDLEYHPRVRVINVGPRKGGNNARSEGITAAQGDFIALLDDDDVWDSSHLELLFSAVRGRKRRGDVWLATSAGWISNGKIYPTRMMLETESLGAYLFGISGFGAAGKGAISTSTMLFPKFIAEDVPWRRDLRFHQDLTWLLDVERKFVNIDVVQIPNATVTFGDTPGSVSKGIGVEKSIQWAKSEILGSNRDRRREFSDFLLTRYPLRAAASRLDAGQVLYVYKQAIRHGRLSVPALVYSGAFILSSLRGLAKSRRITFVRHR